MKRILAIVAVSVCICLSAGCHINSSVRMQKQGAEQGTENIAEQAVTRVQDSTGNTDQEWVCYPHICYRMEIPDENTGLYHSRQHHGRHHGDGAYIPSFYLDEDNRTFTFSYNPGSSYYICGTYETEDGILTAITNDGKYQYRFRINEDGTLTFIQKGSSEIDISDTQNTPLITDGAVFFPGQA